MENSLDSKMSLLVSDYSALEKRLVLWAEARPDIRAIFVVGSRGLEKPDQSNFGSDLDIIVATSKSKFFSGNGISWCTDIAPVILVLPQPQRHMVFTFSEDYYVVFKPDLDVDFSIVPLQRLRQEIWTASWFAYFSGLQPPPTASVKRFYVIASALHQGFRTLVDRDGLASEMQSAFASFYTSVVMPSLAELLATVDEFLLFAFKAIKKINSGKRYAAKWICDVTLQMLLIRMATWHIHTQRCEDTQPVRYRDLRLDEWADPRLLIELPKTFASYNHSDIYRALQSAVDLFYWVTTETATQLGYQDQFIQVVDRFEWLRAYLEICQEAHA